LAFATACAAGVTLAPDVSFYNRSLLVLPVISVFLALPRTVFHRAARKLALFSVSLPIGLLAVAWLLGGHATPAGSAPRALVESLLSASEAVYVVLPLLLLPALLAHAVSNHAVTHVPFPKAQTRGLAFTSAEWRVKHVLTGLACIVGVAFLASNMLMTRDSYHAWYAARTPDAAVFPSDLFQPWYAGRAMLAGRTPYSDEVTDEMHTAYYGTPLRGAKTGHSEMRFYYPPFVVMVIAPFLALPFETARWLGTIALVLALGAAGMIAARLAGERRRTRLLLAAMLAVAFKPAQEAIWIQQLSGFVVLLVIGASAAVATRRYRLAGALLALGLFKPQVVVIPAAALLFWALWCRARWQMVGAFAITVFAELFLAQLLAPAWVTEFAGAASNYAGVNNMLWLPSVVLGGNTPATLFSAALVLFVSVLWWRARYSDAGSSAWLRLLALTCVVRAVLVPDVSYYNKALLILPMAVIVLAPETTGRVARSARRLALLAMATPYVVSGAIGTAYLAGWQIASGELFLRSVEALTFLLPFLLLPASVGLCWPRAKTVSLTRESPDRSVTRSDGTSPVTLPALDALRGLAALYVVLHHAYGLLWVGDYAPALAAAGELPTWAAAIGGMFRFGRQAVLLFFVLSGFCIHYRQARVLPYVNGTPMALPHDRHGAHSPGGASGVSIPLCCSRSS
jgi:hypothetical protein